MTFMEKGVRAAEASLVNHTGSMIRFTTSQLEYLPDKDTKVYITTPDGKTIEGKFHPNHENPYIGGPEVVDFVKSHIEFGETKDIVVEQTRKGNHIKLKLK